MSRKKTGLLYDIDVGESDPPTINTSPAYQPLPPGGSTPTTPTGCNYGTDSCTVTIQPGSLPSGSGKTHATHSILTPASSPSSEDDLTQSSRVQGFGNTPSGKSSRAASETRLLVTPEDIVAHAENSNVDVVLADPDTAGVVTLWNGIKVNVTDFINKERGRKEVEKPMSDFFCCLRVWSVLGHFGVLVCLPLLLWLLLTRTGRELEEEVENESQHKLWFTTPVALTSLFLGLSYLLILCDAFSAKNRPYMAHLMSLDDAHQYVTNIRQHAPKIMLKVRCYHYVENSFGKPYKRITYEESREFLFRHCRDLSGYLHQEDFPPGYVTKVKMRRMFGFLDEATADRYKTFKSSIIDRNSPKDVYIDVEEVMEIDSLHDKISVFLDDSTKPHCVDYRYYWLSALCFLTLPYRYWFAARTTQTAFTYVKLVGV